MAVYFKNGLLTASAFVMAAFWVSLSHPEVMAAFGGGAAVALRVLFGLVIAGLLFLSAKRN